MERENYQRRYNNALEKIRYVGKALVPTYVKSLFENGLNPYFTQIDQIFHPNDAERNKNYSVKQSQQQLSNSQKLSTVHQKEGHILISWLAQFIPGEDQLPVCFFRYTEYP